MNAPSFLMVLTGTAFVNTNTILVMSYNLIIERIFSPPTIDKVPINKEPKNQRNLMGARALVLVIKSKEPDGRKRPRGSLIFDVLPSEMLS